MIAYPDELPSAGLNGVSGGPLTAAVEFENDVGPNNSRERVGLTMDKFRVELPPLTQAQYETFQLFYHTILYDGILPFTFTDPMTKETKVFKFSGGYTENRATPDYLKVSFELILIHSAAK